MSDEKFDGLLIAAVVGCLIISVTAAITLEARHEDSVLAGMIEAGADPLEAGCAVGRLSSCDVIGRKQ